MKDTRKDLRIGFYGGIDSDGQHHPPADCKKLVNHCLNEAQQSLLDDKLLTGTLGIDVQLTELGQEIDPNLISNVLGMNVEQEGGDDVDHNDKFFVEDDCDEESDEESDDENE